MTETFEIIVGTYEEFLLGYKFSGSKLTQSFAVHDHTASIRSVAISGINLASGSTDDRIIIYNLKTRREHCMLTNHNSTVNVLEFTPNSTHLISGSSDGVLAITRVGNWQLEKNWDKAHKESAIIDIAVHETGKLALTLGADCTLRTWNLVKGRQAYIINLNSKSSNAKSLEGVLWAPDGVRFAMFGGQIVEIWSIETGAILNTIAHEQKVCCLLWISDKKILVGYENGHFGLVVNNKLGKTFEAHTTRIKALASYDNFIVSATSGGEITVWDKKLKKITSHSTGCRLTCLKISSMNFDEKKVEETKEGNKKRVNIKQVENEIITLTSPEVNLKTKQSKVIVTNETINPKKSLRKKRKVTEESSTPTKKVKLLNKKKKHKK